MRIRLFDLTDAARRADEALLRMAPAARDELARAAQAFRRRVACTDECWDDVAPDSTSSADDEHFHATAVPERQCRWSASKIPTSTR